MGLREDNRQRTRQAISDAATRLFIEHGFERVTIAQVAAGAGVAKMTVTNYFPRKEDLALDIHEAFVRTPAEVIAGHLEPAKALESWYYEALSRRDPILGFAGKSFVRMIADSPTLLGRLRELHEQREANLAAALPGDPFVAKVEAALLAGVLKVLFDEVQARTLNGGVTKMKELAGRAFAVRR